MRKIISLFIFILFTYGSTEGLGQVPPQNDIFSKSLLSRSEYLMDKIKRNNVADVSANDWLKQAENDLKAGDISGAIRNTEKALKVDDKNLKTWQQLANLYEKINNTYYAVASYIQLYHLSTNLTDAEKSAALIKIADLLIKENTQSSAKEALELYTKANELKFNTVIAKKINDLKEVLEFNPKNITTVEVGDERQACINFNDNLSTIHTVRWSDYIRVEPTVKFSVTVQNEKSLCIDGLAYGKAYKINLLKGLPNSAGEGLSRNRTLDVAAADRSFSLGFKNAAYVLPKIGSTGVPLISVNYNEAYLKLLRINDRNLLNDFVSYNFLANIAKYNVTEISDRYGELVWNGTVTIESQKNQRVTTSIPLLEMVKNQLKPGVYILTAGKSVVNKNGMKDQASAGEEEDYYSLATQWIIVTDLGISTYSSDNGLTVAARSLETGKAAVGVKVQLYATNNEQLAEVTTNNDGVATFASGVMLGQGGRSPAMVMMTSAKADDFSFLDLNKAAFDLSDRGVNGRSYTKNYDLYFYTDRGVYRPGETIRLAGLLRNNQGLAATKLPLILQIIRPDGVLASQFVVNDRGIGGYEVSIPTNTDSLTGRWRVLGYVDPKSDAVGTVSYLVEEVIPAQLEVSLAADFKDIIVQPNKNYAVSLKADYLYGAPAADLVAKTQIVFKQNSDPYPEFAGYKFGLVEEPFKSVIVQTEATTTEKDGTANISLPLQLPDSQQPLQAQLSVSVIEPSGRPVMRSLTFPVRGIHPLIGIKSNKGADVTENSVADFQVILVGQNGKQQNFDNLKWRLVKENYRYQWFYHSGYWDYKVSIQEEEVGSGKLSGSENAPAILSTKFGWGRYRLEVFNEEGTSASSIRLYAGWGWGLESADTPDKLEIAADKPSYLPGEKAKISIRAPFKGELLLNVATDKIISSQNVAVSPEGVVVEIPVSKDWGAGAYIVATAFRPGSTADKGPGRAIGVAWLGLNKDVYKIGVSISVPDKVEPNQQITIPVKVSGLQNGQPAFITVAAVDEGVLSLTDFVSPDPLQYFFGRRMLGVDLRDLYGQLIDGKSRRRGQIREGGDASAEKGAPSLVKLVALYSGMVQVDAQGNAAVKFDLPDYNGKLRIMAVVHTQDKVGSASANLIVRSPLVTTMNMPRFLALGDKSQFVLSIQNMDALPGLYKISLTSPGKEIQLSEQQAVFQTELNQSQQINQVIAVQADKLGVASIKLKVEGPNGFSLERQFAIRIRSAQAAQTERTVQLLNTGESFKLEASYFTRFVPETVSFKPSISNRPNFDVAGLLDELDRYPYGCLEQITSRALPLVYLFELAQKWDVGITDNPEEIKGKIERALQLLTEKQRFDGSFGLWSSGSNPEPWLSAYVIEFMARAKAKGFAVPDLSYRQGLSWLAKHAEDYQLTNSSALSSRAYALYVLAYTGAGDISTAKYFYDTYLKTLPDALSIAHVAAALSLYGDQERATAGFKMALARYEGNIASWADYGSSIRDLAAIISLTSESKVPTINYSTELNRLVGLLQKRYYLSTQEQVWLVMAARSLAGENEPLNVVVNQSQKMSGLKPSLPNQSFADLSKQGFSVTNAGSPMWVAASVTGVPVQPLPALSNGFIISKRFYDLDGKEIELSNMKQTDIVVVVIEGMAMHKPWNQTLIVDLLPAGLELENSRLANTNSLKDIEWLKDDISVLDHVEYLDDRFVAALTTQEGQKFKVAYMARVITPGTYMLPAVQIEAMYQPEIRARGEILKIIINPFKLQK
ncbi:MAG: hypothetical protein IPP67_01310 [Rhodospirillaceae bacterium]|nr:hypothetical protein [Rhodospirillaceae bacterium]